MPSLVRSISGAARINRINCGMTTDHNVSRHDASMPWAPPLLHMGTAQHEQLLVGFCKSSDHSSGLTLEVGAGQNVPDDLTKLNLI